MEKAKREHLRQYAKNQGNIIMEECEIESLCELIDSLEKRCSGYEDALKHIVNNVDGVNDIISSEKIAEQALSATAETKEER